jgi:3-oxoacyl-[acyl-carrier-protein] synthase III
LSHFYSFEKTKEKIKILNPTISDSQIENCWNDLISVATDEYGNVYNDNNLYMNGPEIFSFTSDLVPDLTKAILKKINKNIIEIDLFIFHQANKYMLNHLRKRSSERFQ